MLTSQINNEQTVQGNQNQVAGGDIINQSSFGIPKPENPNMMSCPICTDYWVSKDAVRCPGCGGFLDSIMMQKQTFTTTTSGIMIRQQEGI